MKAFFSSFFSAPSALVGAGSTLGSDADRVGLHVEIACIAVRDVLRKYGVPGTWITASARRSVAGRREAGVHLCLSVREWHPELLPYMVNLEQHVRRRALRLDPLAAEWLAGISWRFDLVDSSVCPRLPDPAFWQAGPSRASAGVAEHVSPSPTAVRAGADEVSGQARAEAGNRGAADFQVTQPMRAEPAP